MNTTGQRVLILFVKLAVNALALIVVDRLLPGIQIADWQTTVAAAVLLALVNAYLRPIALLLTLPLNIITLGLFTFILNGLLLWLVSALLSAFHIAGFWTAVGGAFIISVVSFLLNWFLRPPTVQVHVYRG